MDMHLDRDNRYKQEKINLKKLIQSFLFFYSVVFLALKPVEKIKTHKKSSALEKITTARTIHDPSTNYQELILVTNEPDKDSQKRKKGAKIVTFFSPQMILNCAFWKPQRPVEKQRKP